MAMTRLLRSNPPKPKAEKSPKKASKKKGK